MVASDMGPQEPQDVVRDAARDLSGMAGERAPLKGDATHWLTDPEYAAIRHRLEAAHAAVEVTLIEARRRVRLNEGRGS
jgi:hypothetical protein